jgi:hypothetical protein
MMKEMGQELTEEQVGKAMKDLDTDNSGDIDLDEFTKWYFSGMQTYSGVRKHFRTVQSKGMKLLDVIGEEAKNIMMKEELKYKKNKFSVSLNAPENPKTELKVKVNIGGSDNEQLATDLHSKYHDAVHVKNEAKEFSV